MISNDTEEKVMKRKLTVCICIAVCIIFGACAKKDSGSLYGDGESVPIVSESVKPGESDSLKENVTESVQSDNTKNQSVNTPAPTKEAKTPTDIPIPTRKVKMPTGTPIPEAVEKELLKKTVIIGEDEFEEIKAEISFETIYDYSDYFNIEKSLECYEQYQAPDVVSNNIIVDNKVDLDKLYETVLRNNAGYERKKSYEQFSDSTLYDFCKIICENLNEKLSTYPVNLNDLDYILSNLKIMGYNGFAFASVAEDNMLSVNLKSIEKLPDGGLENTLAHEAMHLIQKTPDESVTGVTYRFPELKVNALYYKWYVEASAEQIRLDIGEKEMLYTNLIHYLNALNLANCNSEVNVELFNFTKNPEEFYSLFCEGEILSQKEIICMMKAIDYITDQGDDFLDGNNIRLDAYERNDLIERYIGQVYETLSKKFYYDLGCMLKEGRTVEDVFSLVALFESQCAMQTFYNDPYRLESNEQFIRTYVMIQKEVFELVAEKAEMDLDELYALYNQYNEKKSVTIACTAKDEYLNAIYARIKHKQGESVKSIFDAYLE